MNKSIDLGRIAIPDDCTVETPKQLLAHPKLQEFLNRLNDTGQLNHLIAFDNEGITKREIQRDYEVFTEVRKAFENSATVEATPAKFQQITAIIDQIGDNVRSLDVDRDLPESEVIERLAKIGIDIVAYQQKKGEFYMKTGYAKWLLKEDIIDDADPVLPIPELTEAQMQKIESLRGKGIDFDLHIYDNRFDRRKTASLFIDKNAERGIKLRAGNVASTKSLNEDELDNLAMIFRMAESSRDMRDALEESVDSDEYIGYRPKVSLVCVMNDQRLIQDSFSNMISEDEDWVPADYALLLDMAAYYKYCNGEHDPKYGSISAAEDKFGGHLPAKDEPQTQTIINNISNDGKKVIVLEGNPAADFEVYRIAPNRGITNHTRRRVIFI